MRVLFSVLFLLLSASPIHFPAVASAGLVALVFTLSYIDLRRRRETDFLHNLGIPAVLIVLVATLPAVVAESAIHIAGSLIK